MIFNKGEDPTGRRGGYRQTTLRVLSGNELLARTILQEVVKTVLEERYPDINTTENKPRIFTPEVKQISASNRVTNISSASACCTESDSSISNKNWMGTIAEKVRRGNHQVKDKVKVQTTFKQNYTTANSKNTIQKEKFSRYSCIF